MSRGLRHCAAMSRSRKLTLRVLGCAAWLGWGLWRRRDHEPAAIYDSGAGVLRNGRSRGRDRRLAGWLRFGRHREHPAQCQSRTAQHLSPPTPGSRMNRRQSQWATPLSLTPLSRTPLSLAPKWRRPPNPRRGRPPTRRRPRISRNRSSWPRCPIRRRRCRPIYRPCRNRWTWATMMSPNRRRQRAMHPHASSAGTQDFRYLICYVWSELPPAEKPAAIVLRSFKDIPVGTPVEEIKRASDAFGLDFTFHESGCQDRVPVSTPSNAPGRISACSN